MVLSKKDNVDSLSVILPLYNEAANIKNLVNDLISHIKKYNIDFEILLINDGSTDISKSIMESLIDQQQMVQIISHDRNKGYGSAIQSGINKAQNGWALIMDGDGQFKINELSAFWDKRSFYNIILGYRQKRNDNAYRNLLGKLGNLMANFFLKTNIFIKDINCGFKLFKLKELKTAPLASTGGIINFEILYWLLKHNRTVAQLPVIHYQRKTGRATGGRLKTIIIIIKEFIQLMLKTRLFN
ncbi:MAG: glycosyltransferase family 2 protein [Candidatus Omnitrophota bacterium]